MLSNAKGADNGFTIKTYEKGKTYDLTKSLAMNFIGQKVAKEGKVKIKPDNNENLSAPETKNNSDDQEDGNEDNTPVDDENSGVDDDSDDGSEDETPTQKKKRLKAERKAIEKAERENDK